MTEQAIPSRFPDRESFEQAVADERQLDDLAAEAVAIIGRIASLSNCTPAEAAAAIAEQVTA